MRKILSIVLFVVMATISQQALALTVTATESGDDLVNAILGSGITNVSNIVYSGAATGASGTFTGGGNIGFDTGILLTTGSAVGAEGPNTSDSYTGGGVSTSLAFNFTSTGGTLYFSYVFASEEYNEYVGSQFNDLFKLYLDGVNIALVGTDEVTVNNVNLGKNSAYYRDNEGVTTYNTQYDGLTTVLVAQAVGLGAGSHNMQFLIADVGDSAYDSGVFIQGGTFSDQPAPPPNGVPEPGTMMLLGSGLVGLASFGRKHLRK